MSEKLSPRDPEAARRMLRRAATYLSLAAVSFGLTACGGETEAASDECRILGIYDNEGNHFDSSQGTRLGDVLGVEFRDVTIQSLLDKQERVIGGATSTHPQVEQDSYGVNIYTHEVISKPLSEEQDNIAPIQTTYSSGYIRGEKKNTILVVTSETFMNLPRISGGVELSGGCLMYEEHINSGSETITREFYVRIPSESSE